MPPIDPPHREGIRHGPNIAHYQFRLGAAHPKALQERLGHSSVTVTLDRYGHLYEGLDGQIAASLDGVLRASRDLAAAWEPSEDSANTSGEDKSAGHRSGASWNRTSDLILIRDAL
jgi:hypothetical protein